MVNLSMLDGPSKDDAVEVFAEVMPDLAVASSEDDLLLNLLGEDEYSVSELDRVVCFLVARGMSFEQASARLGLTERESKRLKRRKELLQLVLQIQTALQIPLTEQIKRLAPLALQKKMELILHGKNENVQNSAASFIIEQAEGRATQKIEMQSLTLDARAEMHELDTALRAQQDRLHILAEQKQKLLEARAKAS